MSSIAARPSIVWMLSRIGIRPLDWFVLLLPVVGGIGLFALALSDGGQHIETLAWVQTAVVLALAAIVWRRGLPRVAVTWAMLGMLATIAVSLGFSIRPEATIRDFFLWLMYLGFFAITSSSMSGPVAIRRFVEATVAIGGWLCLIGLFVFWGANNPGMRWYSTFYWPNPFAGFLLLLVPVTLVRYLHTRAIRECAVQGAMALLLSVSLILTYSRGAWVSMALILPVALGVLPPQSWRVWMGRIVILAVLLLATVVAMTRGNVLEESTRGLHGSEKSVVVFDDLSVQGRLEFVSSAVRMFLDHPVIGTGSGTFGAAHARYQRDVRFYAKDAHNKYVQTAAELGIIGVGMLAAVVVSSALLWRQSLQKTRHTPEYPIVAGIGLGVLAFVLHSAMDMDWSFPAVPAMAFALVGVLAAYDRMTLESRLILQPGSGSRRILPVLGLIVAVGGIQLLSMAQRQFDSGQRLAQSGQWEAATHRYATGTRWNPLNARYWGGLANAATHLAPPRQDVAVASLRRAIAVDRMNAVYPLQLGTLFMAQGDAPHLVEAEGLFRQALRLDSLNRPDAYRTLALLYVREGRFDEASEVYADGIGRYRGQGLGRGSILYLQLWPQVTTLFLDAEEFSLRRGDVPRSVEILQQLLAEDPSSVAGALRLATLYVQQGKPGEARRVLEGTAARVPTSEEIQAALRQLP